MQSGPDSLRVTYARTAQGGVRSATFDDGAKVIITASRARSYPGLPSDAPHTLALYKLAAKALPKDACVIDVGCGAGIGTRVLAGATARVVGVDVSDEALTFSKRVCRSATNATIERADACEALPESFDSAVTIDVLAHLSSPEDALASVAAQLKAGATLFVAEPAAHPEQCLRAPARRAFTKRSLASLLLTAGFAVETWHAQGTFLACTARRIDDDGARALAAAVRTTSVPWALSLFGDAMKSERVDVQLEALLGRAELCFVGGEGDAACRLWFDARALTPTDARATLGLARASLATGNHEDAKTLAEIALRADACDADAHATLARAKESLGECALDAWRVAANLAPDSVEYAAKLVDAAIAAHDPKRAVFTAERLREYSRDGAPHAQSARDAQIVYAKALLADGRESDARYERRAAR